MAYAAAAGHEALFGARASYTFELGSSIEGRGAGSGGARGVRAVDKALVNLSRRRVELRLAGRAHSNRSSGVSAIRCWSSSYVGNRGSGRRFGDVVVVIVAPRMFRFLRL